MRFVYGNRERVFVNTALGCNAKCKYCYLPDVHNGERIIYSPAETVIKLVKDFPDFVQGEEGTIISIGCYSECLDLKNVTETKTILEKILPVGNYIQLATKQVVDKSIIDIIKCKRLFQEQVSIYVSMPTISGISQLEIGTALFQDRVNNIKICKDNGIVVVLYIKPFLEQLTADDKEKYIELINKYHIPIIIGGYLSVKNSVNKADVGEELLYEQKQSSLYEKFVLEFDEICDNYRHSIELIKHIREIRKKVNDRGIY